MKPYSINDGVTQSMLLAFMSCRQLSKYNLEHWEREDNTGEAMLRGDIIHTCLDYYYTKKYSINKTLDVFRARSTHNEKTESMMDIIHPLMSAYIEYWSRNDKAYQYLECEKVFDVKFNGIRLRGKRDAVVSVRAKDGSTSRWLFETKTKAQIEEESIQDQLGFDFQSLLYITAYKLETGIDLSGVIYNIIRWPQYKNVDNFENALTKDPAHFFKRYPCTYTKRGRLAFETDLKVILDEYVRHVETIRGEYNLGDDSRELPTYKNTSHCTSKFGTCPFLKACASGTMAGYSQTREHFKELTSNESKEQKSQSDKAASKLDKFRQSIQTYKAGKRN